MASLSLDRRSVVKAHMPPSVRARTLPGRHGGMTLEAIAALLGHRSLDMTLRYAKSPS
jgi:hypothetical protein